MKTRIAFNNQYFASSLTCSVVFFLFLCSFANVNAANPFAIGGGLDEPKDISIRDIPHDDLVKMAKAETPKPEVCYELGSRYYSGRGVNQDFKTASIWFKKAADLGDPASQTTLGYLYYQGKGVELNHKKAFEYFHEAAKQKFARAQYNLGLMYYRGIGVDKNLNQAVLWFSRAAKNNNGQSQYVLGCLYLVAEGVNEDYISAYKWLLLAEYNNIDVDALKTVVEQSLSTFEKQKAVKLASDFIDELKDNGKLDSKVSSEIIPDGPIRGGTGFFITKDGYILTSYHIIRDSQKIKIKSELGIIPAKLVLYDSTIDFALLKIDGYVNCKALPLARADYRVKLEEPVWTFGYKTAIKTSDSPDYVSGVITSLSGNSQIQYGRQKEVLLKQKTEEENIISKSAPNVRFFQLECSAGPGNAGGAIIGKEGYVIGVFASEFEGEEKYIKSGNWPVQNHYAAKTSFILPFLEIEPELTNKINLFRTETMLDKPAIMAKNATVQVLIY